MSGPKRSNPEAAETSADRQLLSVAEFCRSHSISRALFYKLHKQGKAPRICKVGARSLISADDAAAWRHDL